MGSRLTLPLLLLAALVASGLFWWLSTTSSSRPQADPTRGITDSAEAPEAPPAAELEQPDLVKQPTRGLDRAVVQQAPGRAREHDHGAPSGPGIEVRGVVVDRLGSPLAGVEIIATDQSGFSLDITGQDFPWMRRFTATTDEEGKFALDGPQPGELRLAARAAGYAPFDRDGISIPADESVELDPITMSLGAVLTGHVVDPTGSGVGGAELVRVDDADHGGLVVLGGRKEPLTTTAEDGSFRVDQIACGPWKIQVRTEAHPDRTFEGLAERPGEEVGGLEFMLGRGATISGRVTEIPPADRGQLVVRAGKAGGDGFSAERRRKAEVAADGSFTLRGLEVAGVYDLLVQKEDDPESHFSGWFGRTRSESVRATAGDTGILIPYQPEGALAFQVLDSASGTVLTEFEVKAGIGWPQPLMGEDRKPLRQHPEGRVRVGNLRPSDPDERVELIVEATGYRTFARDDIAVANGQEIDLGPIYLDPVPVLRVTVLDKKSRAPVVGASVTLAEEQPAGQFTMNRRIEIDSEDGVHSEISGGGDTVRTDENGVAVLTSKEDRTCKLSVRADDHARFELAGLYLPTGKSVEQTVELTPGGAVEVTVFDSEGGLLPGARVQHRRPGQGSGPGGFFVMGHGPEPAQGRKVTDSEGKVLFENLEPGEHSFRIAESSSSGMFLAGEDAMTIDIGGDYASGDDWSAANVVEGETAALSLTASPRGTLAGSVREAGKLLAGASLSLSEKKDADPQQEMMMGLFGGGENAKTDGDGEYRFDNVKEGTYVLKVEHPTRRMPSSFEVDVELGETEFDIDLPVSILEGRIVDPEGKPVPGLTVRAEEEKPSGQAFQAFAIRMESDGGDTVVSTSNGLGGGPSATTDDNGYYTLRGVTPDVDLVVKAEGDSVQPAQSEVVQVGPDEVRRNVDLTAEPGGAVDVEAVLADGAPARFCMVRANYQGDAENVQPEFSFLQSGSTTLTGLRPGPWLINVQKSGPGRQDGDAGVDQEVEVVAGETAKTTIRLD